MPKPKLLIVSEQKSVFKLYELLLQESFSHIKTLFIEENDFIETINFNHFNLILKDLNGKKYLPSLNELSKKSLKNCKIILISPYDSGRLSSILSNRSSD